MRKKYNYKETLLFVGAEFTDCNNFTLVIIGCGPHRVKAIVKGHPEIKPTFTAHWHFVENTVKRGTLTSHL